MNMDYFNHIIDFADGTLEIEKEEELFLALSSSEELRAELKYHLAIKQAIKEKKDYFAPPAGATLSLFSKLDIDTGIISGIKKSNNAGRIKSIARDNLKQIYTGLISVMATAAVFLFIIMPNTKQVDKPTTTMAFYSSSNKPQEKHISNKPEIPNDQNSTHIYSKKIITNNNQTPVNRLSSVSEESVPVKEQLIEDISTPATVPAFNDKSGMQPINKQFNFALPVMPELPKSEEPMLPIKGEDNKFSVDVSQTPSWFFGDNNPETVSKPLLANTSFSVIWHASGSVACVLEIRDEYFTHSEAKNFLTTGENILEFDNNVVSTSGGVRFTSIDGNLKPFGQFLIGFNRLGIVLRTDAGVIWQPYDQISFDLSFEYSHLFYGDTDNYLRNSKKLGIIYGISYYFGL